MTESAENIYTEDALGLDLEMVWIPPGSFMMGSPESEEERGDDEGPQHKVTLDGFWMGKYQVTQDQWMNVMGSNPSHFKGIGRLPVESVSWIDAAGFCRKLSASAANTYGLPTEAQWEYACRAGTRTPFHFGGSSSSDQANYNGIFVYGSGRLGPYRKRTIEVGSFPANTWGLHDMHGNVWEWCADWFDKEFYASSPERNPTGPTSAAYRVLRGGSWLNYPQLCRSACRSYWDPSVRAWSYGFRVVRVASPR